MRLLTKLSLIGIAAAGIVVVVLAATGVPVELFASGAVRYTAGVSAMAIAAGAIAILVLHAVKAQLGKRVGETVDALDAIRCGEYGVNIADTDGSDELSSLQRRINEMADLFARRARERESAAKWLQDSEKRFRDFAESTADALWETDAELRYTWFRNPGGTFANVPSENSVIGAKRGEYFSELQSDSDIWKQHREDLENRIPFRDFRFSALYPDGSEFHRVSSGTPYFDEDGNFAGYRGTTTDVTARVEAERRLSNLVSNIPGLVFQRLIYPDGSIDYTYLSSVAERLFGSTSFEECARRAASLERIHPDDRARVREAIVEGARRGVPTSVEFRHSLPDGETVWIQLNNSAAMRRTDGVMVQDGFSVNITGLKNAEREARLAEDRLAGFMRAASDSLWETDSEHRLVWISDPEDPAAVRTYQKSEMLGRRRWEYPNVDPPDSPTWDSLREALDNCRPIRDFEFENRTRDGRVFVRRISGNPVFDENGTFTGYRGVSTDISERVMAERAARANQQRLIDAIQASDQGVALFDADDRLIFLNDAFRRLQVLFADLFVVGRRFEDILRDAAQRGVLSTAIGEEQDWIRRRLEYHRDPDGIFASFQLEGRHIQVRDERLPDGGAITHLSDVTAQTEIRQALQRSEERFRSFAESSSDWMWETDTDHRIVWISDSVREHTEIPISGLVGQTRWDALGFSPETNAHWRGLVEAMDTRQTIREFRFSRTDGSGRTLHRVLNGAPVFDDNGAFIGYRGTVADTTDLVEAQQRARAAEGRFVDAINNANEGLILFGPDDGLVFANMMAKRILGEVAKECAPGVPFETLIRSYYGHNPVDVEPDGVEERIAARIARHRNREDNEPFIVRRIDGLVIEVREEYLPDGSTILFQNDITDRIAAEDALLTSEQRFRDFAEASSDWMWELDADLRFIWHSSDDDPAESTGTPAAGRTPWEMLGVDIETNENFRQHMDDLLARRPFRDFRYPKVLLDGTVGYRSISGIPSYNSDGDFLGYRGTTTDITEQVEAEQRYRNLIEQTPTPLFVHRATIIKFVNSAAIEMFGVERADELIGRSILDFIPGKDRETFIARMRSIMDDGAVTDLIEQKRLRLDGTEISVMSRGVPVIWEGERAVLATQIDITDRLRAERQYRELIENAPMPITVDDGNEYLFVNQAFAELDGAASPIDVVGRPIADTAHPEDMDQFYERVRAIAKYRQTLPTAEIRQRRLDGAAITVLSRAVPIVWEGRPATLGMQVDISDRIAAQEALKDSEERFRNLVEGSRQGVLLHVDYKPVFANAALAEMFGYDGIDEILSLDSVLELVAPEECELWREYRTARLSGLDAPDGYEFAGVKKDGSRIWLHMTVRVVAWDGRTALQGTMIDITEQRAAIETIRASEERFRVLTATSPVGVFVTDSEGRCEYVNEAFQNMSGLMPDEVAGRSWLDTVHPDDRKRIAAEWQNEVGLNRPFRTEFRILRPDGAVAWGIGQAAPLRDSNGRIVNFIGAITDVTARRETEQALESSEERFRMLTMLSPVGVFLTNPEGEIEYVNEALSRMLGMSPHSATGRNWINGINPDDRRKVIAAWRDALRDRRELELEIRMGDGTGDDRWTFVQASPLRSGGSDSGGYVGAVTDITDRRHAEEQLRQVHKMDAVGQLTGGIAHDFNNLLAIVQGNLELLRERASDEKRVQSLIDAAHGAAKRGATLNQRLLAFARRQPLRPEKCNISEIVEDMTGLFGRTLGEHVELRTDYAAGLWYARVDPNGLETAVLNLAINARDAMPDGGLLTIETANAHFGNGRPAPTKEVGQGEYVMLRVSDTGTGMDATTIEKAFDPFFTTKESGKGSGLGLSMVYGFMRQSGGHVTIDSAADLGTAITLYFPRDEGEAPVRERRQAIMVPSGGGERILVVEDDADVRDVAVGMFTSLNYRTLEAANADEALRILEDESDIELLFTDVMLGNGETGPDLARRARKKFPGLRILFTSGYAKTEFEQGDPIELGALINKPFERIDLARAVRAALDTSRA